MYKHILVLLFLLQLLQSIAVTFLCVFIFTEHYMTSVVHTIFVSIMLGLSIANVGVTLGFAATVPTIMVLECRRRASVTPSIPTAQIVTLGAIPPPPPPPERAERAVG